MGTSICVCTDYSPHDEKEMECKRCETENGCEEHLNHMSSQDTRTTGASSRPDSPKEGNTEQKLKQFRRPTINVNKTPQHTSDKATAIEREKTWKWVDGKLDL